MNKDLLKKMKVKCSADSFHNEVTNEFGKKVMKDWIY